MKVGVERGWQINIKKRVGKAELRKLPEGKGAEMGQGEVGSWQQWRENRSPESVALHFHLKQLNAAAALRGVFGNINISRISKWAKVGRETAVAFNCFISAIQDPDFPKSLDTPN